MPDGAHAAWTNWYRDLLSLMRVNLLEWDLPQFSSGGVSDRTHILSSHPFFVVHHNVINNLTGSTQHEHMAQQEVSLSVLPQTSFGLGSEFLPDINTTTAPLSFASQVDSVVLSSNLFGQHGEIPPPSGFNFNLSLSADNLRNPKPKKRIWEGNSRRAGTS